MTQNGQIPIDYIEFAVADIPRAKDFFARAFGWTFTDYGDGYCEFSDGRMRGGFERTPTKTTSAEKQRGPLVILHTDDLAAAERRIRDAGGRITVPVFDFPGGRRLHFLDPDGHELAIWTETATDSDP